MSVHNEGMTGRPDAPRTKAPPLSSSSKFFEANYSNRIFHGKLGRNFKIKNQNSFKNIIKRIGIFLGFLPKGKSLVKGVSDAQFSRQILEKRVLNEDDCQKIAKNILDNLIKNGEESLQEINSKIINTIKDDALFMMRECEDLGDGKFFLEAIKNAKQDKKASRKEKNVEINQLSISNKLRELIRGNKSFNTRLHEISEKKIGIYLEGINIQETPSYQEDKIGRNVARSIASHILKNPEKVNGFKRLRDLSHSSSQQLKLKLLEYGIDYKNLDTSKENAGTNLRETLRELSTREQNDLRILLEMIPLSEQGEKKSESSSPLASSSSASSPSQSKLQISGENELENVTDITNKQSENTAENTNEHLAPIKEDKEFVNTIHKELGRDAAEEIANELSAERNRLTMENHLQALGENFPERHNKRRKETR